MHVRIRAPAFILSAALPSLVMFARRMRQTGESFAVRGVSRLLAMLMVGYCLIGCTALESAGTAPKKHDTIQSELNLLGRFKPIELDSAMSAVEPAIVATPLDLIAVRNALRAAAHHLQDEEFQEVWTAVLADVGNDKDNAAKVRSSIRNEMAGINDDNTLYWTATTYAAPSLMPNALALARQARDELLVRYITRIQDYHEANFEDVFTGSAAAGTTLDVLTTVSAALATAFVPVNTKTVFSALATIFSGSRLALSKNILNERSAATVLNAMMQARSEALTSLFKGMAKPADVYSVQQGVADLVTYFNAGGLYKAIAQMEANTSTATTAAHESLKTARSALAGGEIGGFTATSLAEEGKQTASLVFDNGDDPGRVGVKSVTVDGKDLTVSEYELKGDNTQHVDIVFKTSLKAGTGVVVKGETTLNGAHKAMLKWQ
jgi:methionine-rich copper-binding protein CopC